MSRQDSNNVIVVGAGASGLAAATALHAAGRDTICLEARDRIGGRLLSVPASHPERALDLGATWFWDGEERVRTLAARSGIETFGQHLTGDTILQESTGTRRYAGNLIDAPSRRFTAGSQSLATALAAALPAESLLLNTPVTAIHPDGQGGLAVLTGVQGSGRARHPGRPTGPGPGAHRLPRRTSRRPRTPRPVHPRLDGGRRQGRRPVPLRLLAGGGAGRCGAQQDRPPPGDTRHVGARRPPALGAHETATDRAGHIEGALAAGERATQAVLVASGVLNNRNITIPTTRR